MAATEGDITRLLKDWRSGDSAAFERLFPLLYPTLKRLAGRELRGERAGHTLQTTALVHEAWLKLALGEQQFESRRHFFGVAAKAMRTVLVDHVRAGRDVVQQEVEAAGFQLVCVEATPFLRENYLMRFRKQ